MKPSFQLPPPHKQEDGTNKPRLEGDERRNHGAAIRGYGNNEARYRNRARYRPRSFCNAPSVYVFRQLNEGPFPESTGGLLNDHLEARTELSMECRQYRRTPQR